MAAPVQRRFSAAPVVEVGFEMSGIVHCDGSLGKTVNWDYIMVGNWELSATNREELNGISGRENKNGIEYV